MLTIYIQDVKDKSGSRTVQGENFQHTNFCSSQILGNREAQGKEI
jgi:hypothetical protein